MLACLGLAIFTIKLVFCEFYDEYEYTDGYHGDSYGDYSQESPAFGAGSDIGRVRRFGESPGSLFTRNNEDIKGALQKIMPGHTELFQDLSQPQMLTVKLTETAVNPEMDALLPSYQLNSPSLSQYGFYEEVTPETVPQNLEETEETDALIPALTPENNALTPWYLNQNAEPSTDQETSTAMMALTLTLTHIPARSTTHGLTRSLTHTPITTMTHVAVRSTIKAPVRSTTHAPVRSTANKEGWLTAHAPIRSTHKSVRSTTQVAVSSTVHAPVRSTTHMAVRLKAHAPFKSTIHPPAMATIQKAVTLTSRRPTGSARRLMVMAVSGVPAISNISKPTRSTTHVAVRLASRAKSISRAQSRSTSGLPVMDMTRMPARSKVRKPTRSTRVTVRSLSRVSTRSRETERQLVHVKLPSKKVTSTRKVASPPTFDMDIQTWKFAPSDEDKNISLVYPMKIDKDIYDENDEIPYLYDQGWQRKNNPILRKGTAITGSTTTTPTTTTVTASETTTITTTETTTITTTETTSTAASTTPSPYLVFDIESFLAVLANLTYEYDTNLTEVMNATLRNNTPTCKPMEDLAKYSKMMLTSTALITTSTPTTTEAAYEAPKDLNNSVIAKCFVCGLHAPGIPYDSDCADAFAGDFLPLTPVNPIAKSKTSSYRKYCRYGEIYNYRENPSRPRSIYGRWTGGCSVRWTDLTGLYTQRSCRNRKRPVTGLHYASKRMAKLEMSLGHTEQGCIISPVATLLPLSRGISLFARFHVCVCSGNWCNGATYAIPSVVAVLAPTAVWASR